MACNLKLPTLPTLPTLPKLPRFHIARGALSLPEGAEIVSRAAARLRERPRSPPTRAPAPAGPENQCAPTAGRSCAPPGAGRCFLARPVAALAGLACRPASYRRARRARQAGPVFQGKGAEHLTALGGALSKTLAHCPSLRDPTRVEQASCLLGRGRHPACPTFKQAGMRVLPNFPPEPQPFKAHASARSVLSRFPEALTHRN